MPKVPSYDAPRVSPGALPGARMSPVAPPVVDVGGPVARQNMGIAQGLSQAGGALADIAMQAQQEANQLRVDDAMNAARELMQRYTFDPQNGYLSIKGRDAMERQSGKPLAIEYTDKLAEDFGRISQGLGNDAQRRAFSSFASQALGQFQGQVMRHEAGEYNTYRASVREGTIVNRTREIALNYDNPRAIQEGITSIRAAVWDLGKLQGWAAEKIEAEQRMATSRAHRTALTAALQNGNVAYAAGYLQRNLRDMDADDILRIGGIIQESSDALAGRGAADSVMALAGPRMAPSDGDRAFNLAIEAESGGRQFDTDGKPLTSSAGAIGIAQMMPATAREWAEKSGIGWDEEKFRNDPQYNLTVARWGFDGLVKKYGGNLAQVYAAYNAGPRWVDEAVARAKEAQPGTSQADWFWQLNNDKRTPENRQQTQGYVERNMRRYAAGLGAGPQPTLAELKAQAASNPAVAGNPAAIKAAETRVESMYKDMEAATKQRQEEALDTAYRVLWENGGQMDKLPVEVRAALPGDKLASVMGFAEKVAKGPVNDASAWAKILSMPAAELAQLTPAEFYRLYRPVLDDAHLEMGYALLKEARGQVESDAKHLEIITTAQRVKQAAMAAKIIPADGKPDKEQVLALAAFERTIDDRVRSFERIDLQSKRRANSEELQRIIDGVLMDRVNVSGTFWDDRDVPLVTVAEGGLADAYVMVGDEKVWIKKIPEHQRNLMVEELRAAGQPVNEQAIANLWVRAGKPK